MSDVWLFVLRCQYRVSCSFNITNMLSSTGSGCRRRSRLPRIHHRISPALPAWSESAFDRNASSLLAVFDCLSTSSLPVMTAGNK